MTSTSHSLQPLRVVQWATGNIGLRSLREIIRDPNMELVGVYTYDPGKVGKDAGTLCGEAPVGVQLTNNASAIHALKADCVVYMPRVINIDDLLTFAEAGTNIVSICMELFDAASGLNAADRERLQAACERSGASVYGTGSSPGFISDILPYALLSVQRRVEAFRIEEFGNMSQRDSAVMLFEQIGFGKPMDPAAYPTPRLTSAPTAFAAIARSAGWQIDEWTRVTDFAPSRSHTKLLAGEIAAGTVGARRLVICGYSQGIERIRFSQYMYVTQDLDADWNLADTGWRVQICGDTPMDIEVKFPVDVEGLAEYTPGLTAYPPVNAVPFVCAARAGLLHTSDLPPLVPAGLAAHQAHWPDQ